ncbi:MAG TPA: DNA adenine methylase, partial [Gemmatimonadaceae bacterium]|nr:DNA adenine methylase [Gemmatimonadaceae bacterium]
RMGILAEYLATCEASGFVTGNFSPAGGRMYFTEENARRIDGARARLHEWHRAGLLGDDAYYLLLASVIEGADRVANTAGVYAAYIKRWQPNALRTFAAVPERPVRGAGSVAHCGDAADVARRLGPVDLLYVDPPYNARQYSGYYHVPEILARGWFGERPPALRGKTGLLAEPVPRSAWCSARRVRGALRELLAATGARHVLVSYNSEGLLPSAALREELGTASADGKVRQFVRRYPRYRSDSDGPRRRYRGTEVRELLYCVRLR